MRRRLWTVGVLDGTEVVTFGPFGKATAEALFQRLQASQLTSLVVFIQPLLPEPANPRNRL